METSSATGASFPQPQHRRDHGQQEEEEEPTAAHQPPSQLHPPQLLPQDVGEQQQEQSQHTTESAYEWYQRSLQAKEDQQQQQDKCRAEEEGVHSQTIGSFGVDTQAMISSNNNSSSGRPPHGMQRLVNILQQPRIQQHQNHLMDTLFCSMKSTSCYSSSLSVLDNLLWPVTMQCEYQHHNDGNDRLDPTRITSIWGISLAVHWILSSSSSLLCPLSSFNQHSHRHGYILHQNQNRNNNLVLWVDSTLSWPSWKQFGFWFQSVWQQIIGRNPNDHDDRNNKNSNSTGVDNTTVWQDYLFYHTLFRFDGTIPVDDGPKDNTVGDDADGGSTFATLLSLLSELLEQHGNHQPRRHQQENHQQQPQRRQQSDDITDKILVVWDIQHSTTMIGAVDTARAVLQALLEQEIWTKELDQTKSSHVQLPEQQQQSNQSSSSSSSSVMLSSSSSVGCITWVILGPQQRQQRQCQPRRGSNNNNKKNNSISVDVVMDSSNATSVTVKVEEERSATTRAVLERENTTVVETMALDWTPSIAPGFE